MRFLPILVFTLFFASGANAQQPSATPIQPPPPPISPPNGPPPGYVAPQMGTYLAPEPVMNEPVAIFGGGCFWCLEADMEQIPGVLRVTSGYSGGTIPNPTHEEVMSGKSGHYEAIKVEYNPAVISYEQLVDYYWRLIDPFDAAGQFCDKGDQYRTVIFFANPTELDAAHRSLKRMQELFPKSRLYVRILQKSEFYPAEEAWQDYYLKDPASYRYYRYRCGRDERLREIWGGN